MKKLLMLLALAVALAGCGGGSGGGGNKDPVVDTAITFVKCYEDGAFYSVEATRDGGYIAAGNKEARVIVVKYNRNGIIEWENKFDDISSTSIRNIKQSSDGGYYASGWTYKFNGTETNGAADIITIKLTSRGAIEWYKMIGGSGEEDCYSSETTPDNGIIVTGNCKSKDILGLPSTYINPTIYFKLDKNGNLVWQKMLGGNGFTYGKSIKRIGNNEEYIITGYNNSSDIPELPLTSSGGIFCVKIDGNGDIENGKMYETGKDSSAYSVGIVNENEIVIVGDVLLSEKKDNYLLKLNSNLEKIWDKSSGGTKSEYLYEMAEVNGQIIAAGETWSSDFDGMTKPGIHNIYIAKYNSDGSTVWQKIVGSNGDDYLTQLKKTDDGGFVIVGQTTGTSFMGQIVNRIDQWTTNSFIVKFDKDGNVR